MKVIAAALLAATISAGGAAAATPQGFWQNTKLAPAASFVAGKPITVLCAYRQATINATVSPTATNIQGATPKIGGDVIYLSPLTCSYLGAWLNGKNPSNFYGVAGSMETLAHEAELARGIADETSATCAGLKAMPTMVRRFFPVKNRATVHAVMDFAYRFWNSQGPAYHAHPC